MSRAGNTTMIQRAEPADKRQRRGIRTRRLGAGVHILLLILAGVCLSACGSHPRAKSLETIYSPNGEPLNGGPLGHPACRDAIAGWFTRVDVNRDGMVDLDEFLADTRHQFAAMDLAKDGEITAAELSTYRAPYEATLSLGPQDDFGAPTTATTRRSRRQRGNSMGISRPGRKGDVPSDAADPVMSADVNLNFRVTLSDFVTYKTKEFTQMDVKHTGRLTLDEVQQSSCPANAKR